MDFVTMRRQSGVTFLLVALLLQLTGSTNAAGFGGLFKIGPQALRAVGIVVGAGVAAVGAGKAAEMFSQVQDMDETLLKLKAQHADESDNAIYSVFYTLNGSASAVMWADIFIKPDVFVILEIEGAGRYLIPDIQNEYAGQPILQTVIARNVEAGKRVAVYMMDDDSVGNELWNSILSSKVSYSLQGPSAISRAIGVNVTASGSIQLLSHPQTIDPPDFIASAVFTAPKSSDGR